MVFSNNLLAGAGGQATGYDIEQSILFNDGDSPKLTGGTGQTGDTTQWTISMWVKRGAIDGGNKTIWSAGDGSNKRALSRFVSGGSGQASEDISFSVRTGGSWYELNVDVSFRDPSAWYHFVWVWDSDNGTAADRMRIYVNGERLTSFSNTPSYPASGTATDSWNNSTYAHQIGFENNTRFFDGYLAEMYHIDGQALTPTSFGETNSNTGQWVPKDASGLTFGTRGWHLKGQDSSALGDDTSGNGNDFTSSGLAAADQVTDTPTNNFATWNPIIPLTSGNFSDGNLEFTVPGSTTSQHAKSTISFTSGEKKVCEMQTVSGSSITLGICDEDFVADNNGFTGDSRGYFDTNGNKIDKDGNGSSYGASFGTSNVIRIEVDLSSNPGTIEFFKDGVSQGDAFTDLDSTKTWFFWCRCKVDAVKANFGQLGFAGTPTTGFTALNTSNIPDPTIADPSAYFDTLIWSGDSSNKNITGLNFTPDFLWIKQRNQAFSVGHQLYDVVRGAGSEKELDSSDSTAEGGGNVDVYGYVSAFVSGGFTATAGSSGDWDYVNKSGTNYVAWNWLAGNTSGSSNTDGSITSTVSASPTSGFSIVTYTGTGANATVGHGLGAVPKMILIKDRSNAESWIVYHENVGNNGNLYLNLTNAKATQAIFNNTTPTSSVFSLGSIDGANKSSANHVAYCFAEVEGFSKFGSYTGNSSTDGPFIHTGFMPEFIMVKSSSNSGTNWDMLDATRETFNTRGNQLFANTDAAEASNDHECDFLSNGFKWRDGSGSNNGSGYTIIYMALARSPFKTANAQ